MASGGSTLLFVYGTLMRGGCRAGALAGQRFRGEARTEPNYRLFDCGSYPGLTEAAGRGGRNIVGELWEVDAACLQRLDRMEGVDEGLYERRPARLLQAPENRSVEAYFYLPSTSGLRDCGVRWINMPRPSQE
ncbi:MAG: gamma-glutamylcyclotransferase [Planctomycetaceae bacterium]